MTPCLEAQLKSHRIWSFAEVWLGLSKDLEVNTMLGIHFLQDQMASYEVEPALLEQVTLQLVKEIRIRIEESKEERTTAMSLEAEEGCHARIE